MFLPISDQLWSDLESFFPAVARRLRGSGITTYRLHKTSFGESYEFPISVNPDDFSLFNERRFESNNAFLSVTGGMASCRDAIMPSPKFVRCNPASAVPGVSRYFVDAYHLACHGVDVGPHKSSRASRVALSPQLYFMRELTFEDGRKAEIDEAVLRVIGVYEESENHLEEPGHTY